MQTMFNICFQALVFFCLLVLFVFSFSFFFHLKIDDPQEFVNGFLSSLRQEPLIRFAFPLLTLSSLQTARFLPLSASTDRLRWCKSLWTFPDTRVFSVENNYVLEMRGKWFLRQYNVFAMHPFCYVLYLLNTCIMNFDGIWVKIAYEFRGVSSASIMAQ